MNPEIFDLIDNIKQINATLSKISAQKTQEGISQEEFDNLHREEFRLSVESSSTRRKLDRQIRALESDPTKIFYINRVKKLLEKV